jgi:hypothetical protein
MSLYVATVSDEGQTVMARVGKTGETKLTSSFVAKQLHVSNIYCSRKKACAVIGSQETPWAGTQRDSVVPLQCKGALQAITKAA